MGLDCDVQGKFSHDMTGNGPRGHSCPIGKTNISLLNTRKSLNAAYIAPGAVLI